MASLSCMSSKAATASPVTSIGSGTSAFRHMAYIRAALTSCSLNSRTLVVLPFVLSATLTPLQKPHESISGLFLDDRREAGGANQRLCTARAREGLPSLSLTSLR